MWHFFGDFQSQSSPLLVSWVSASSGTFAQQEQPGYLISNFLLLEPKRKSGPKDRFRATLRPIMLYHVSHVLALCKSHIFPKISNDKLVALCPSSHHTSPHQTSGAQVSKFLACVFPSSFPVRIHILLMNNSNSYKY